MLSWLTAAEFPLFLAPMSRYTDYVYRQLCKEHGADVMVTEFIRADSIVNGTPEVWEGVDFADTQRPMGVQIFGSTPECMGEAARQIVDKMHPDFLDLNFGCPAKKVTCTDAGSSMLRNLPLLGSIIRKVVAAIPDTPVTAKIRIGWDQDSIVAPEAGRIAENEGARMLTVHARTKAQGYRNPTHWDVVGEVAQAVKIPVIGNGNINSVQDVVNARDTYGCSAAMIGRAALGYPWIFRDIKHKLATGEDHPAPTVKERWELIIRFAELLMSRPFNAQRHKDIQWMRPKLIKMTRDMPSSKAVRRTLSEVSTMEELRKLARAF